MPSTLRLQHRLHRAPRGTLQPGRSRAARVRAGRVRAGRALVELLVATLVLTSATSVVLALTQGAITAADQLAQLNLARSLTRDVAEQLVVGACSGADGSTTRGRTRGSWRTTTADHLVVQAVELHRPRSPGARSTPAPLVATAAGWCR